MHGMLKTLIIAMLLLKTGFVYSSELFTAQLYLQNTNPPELAFLQYNEVILEGSKKTTIIYYTEPDGKTAAKEEYTEIDGSFAEYKTFFADKNCGCRLLRKDGNLIFSFINQNPGKTAVRPYREKLVTGATLTAFAYENMEKIKAGEKAVFFFPAMDLQFLAPFYLKKVEKTPYNRPGFTVVEMKTDNIFFNFFLDAAYLVFDNASGRLTQIHGPSLLQKEINGKKKFIYTDNFYKWR
jgi:hypothetical protein